MAIPSNTNPVRLAYLAGLLDGEGCITIKRSRPNPRPELYRRTETYVFSLCIEMSDPRPINLFCDTFGLTMHHNTSRHLRNPERHRCLYVAQIGREYGYSILKTLLPYLVSKREEAELAIEFYEKCFLAHNHRAKGRNRRPVPIAMLEERHSYYLKLRELKSRCFDPRLPGEPVDSRASGTESS